MMDLSRSSVFDSPSRRLRATAVSARSGGGVDDRQQRENIFSEIVNIQQTPRPINFNKPMQVLDKTPRPGHVAVGAVHDVKKLMNISIVGGVHTQPLECEDMFSTTQKESRVEFQRRSIASSISSFRRLDATSSRSSGIQRVSVFQNGNKLIAERKKDIVFGKPCELPQVVEFSS
eukprot:PhF_6_TR43565/c0_g1_i2/m.66902